MTERHYSDLTLIGRVLRQARPYWPHIGLLFLFGLAATPLALLGPLPLKIAVDSALSGHPLPEFLRSALPEGAIRSRTGVLWVAIGLMLATALLNQLRNLATMMLRVHTGQKLLLSFRAQLFRHVQRLSLSFHDSRGSSDSIYRIQTDAPAIQHLAVDGLIPFISAAATLTVTLYVVTRIDWYLALIALATAPFLAIVSYVRRRYLRPRYRNAKSLDSAAQGVLHEVLGALRIVKAFAQEDREQQRYIRRAGESQRAKLRITLAEGTFGMLSGAATAGGRAIVLFVGISHVMAGTLTLGDLLLVMGYLGQLAGPLATLTSKPSQLQSNLVSAERAFALLDEAPDVFERPHARPLARAQGGISFRDVGFGYGPDRTILENISFEVAPGSRVGIVGTTGAGKTTIASLLLRFYDPDSGTILLDGIDLREYKLDDLRHQFAIVLQDPVLFSTSIAENIAYARPEATEEEIVAAAKAANVHEFIARLPKGYDSLVGERGMRLSGGERQRISLARAFLKDAPILILDEPTSSVDVRTENAIMDAMERLMEGRTSFMITHRTAALRNCSVLLHVEDGRLLTSERPAMMETFA